MPDLERVGQSLPLLPTPQRRDERQPRRETPRRKTDPEHARRSQGKTRSPHKIDDYA